MMGANFRNRENMPLRKHYRQIEKLSSELISEIESIIKNHD